MGTERGPREVVIGGGRLHRSPSRYSLKRRAIGYAKSTASPEYTQIDAGEFEVTAASTQASWRLWGIDHV